MDLYTIYSETHWPMFEGYLRPSVPSDLTLHAATMPQVCATGEFATTGFKQALGLKMRYLRGAVAANLGRLIMYADADVQFFAHEMVPVLLEEIGTADVVAQRDADDLCAGLMAIRCSDRTVAWLDLALASYDDAALSARLYLDRLGDQGIQNHYRDHVSWKYLSPRFWNRRISPDPPDDILAHHANWIVGVDLKLEALQSMRELVTMKRRPEVGRLGGG
jgi:hypothetical protein